jgi:tetratricopeptide (TPR) repeat protein
MLGRLYEGYEALPIFVSKGVELNDVEMIAEVLHETAFVNKEQNKFQQAAKILKQELVVRQKIGQAEYPMIVRALNHLGVTEYELKNNNNKTLKYLREALTILPK